MVVLRAMLHDGLEVLRIDKTVRGASVEESLCGAAINLCLYEGHRDPFAGCAKIFALTFGEPGGVPDGLICGVAWWGEAVSGGGTGAVGLWVGARWDKEGVVRRGVFTWAVGAMPAVPW